MKNKWITELGLSQWILGVILLSLIFLIGFRGVVFGKKPQNSGGKWAEVVIIAPPYLTSQNNPNFNEEPEKWQIQELIYYYSGYYGVDFSLSYELAKFESGFNPKAKNEFSSAKGIYQFIDKTWADNCEGDVYSAEDNIKCAIRIISEGGLKHWTIDKNVAEYLTLLGFIK